MLTPELLEKIKARLGARSCEKAFLSLYCTYRVGGPAQLLAFPETVEELRFLIDTARTADAPFTMLGLGSNLLVQRYGRQRHSLLYARHAKNRGVRHHGKGAGWCAS